MKFFASLAALIFSISFTTDDAHASLIGDSITIEFEGDTYNDVDVLNSDLNGLGLVSGPYLIAPSPVIGYHESAGASFFQFTAFGGQSYSFSGLDWIGSPGVIQSAFIDIAPAIAIANSDLNPTICFGDPICETEIAVLLADAIAAANDLTSGIVAFTDSSVSFTPSAGQGRVNLGFTTSHANPVPEPFPLALFAAGIIGLAGLRSRSPGR